MLFDCANNPLEAIARRLHRRAIFLIPRLSAKPRTSAQGLRPHRACADYPSDADPAH